ncbi:MAG TPA: DPP IV N-terminal domain-containing protein, partial [Pyrinomonadaceae bacterium]|nr:DPP IV N-terminal domain-containing protein [Pyrinomonadaceae bacterium]
LVMGAGRSTDFYAQQVALITYPTGEPARITTDFNNYTGIDITADGGSLAAVQSNRISNIWIVPNADASRAVQIRAGGTNQEGTDGVSWAPDGRIVFYSKASGSDDIWIMNGDGSGAKQLTADAGVNYDPNVTPDGRYIVFVSERKGQPNIWRMDLNGGNVRQLTSGPSDFNPSITPDSKWIFFDSTVAGKPEVWKVSIDGGEPLVLTKRHAENCEVSRDGKFYATEFREDGVSSWRYALFSIEGGEPLKVFDLPSGPGGFRWAPDGRSLNYEIANKGVTNVWAYPLDGGEPKQVTHFKNDLIFNFKWSPDGKNMVMARGNEMADIVLIKDFR